MIAMPTVYVRDKSGKNQAHSVCPDCGKLIRWKADRCWPCRTRMLSKTQEDGELQFFNGIPCLSVALTQGLFAWVDVDRYEDVKQWKWNALCGEKGDTYAARRAGVREENAGASIRMHRYLSNAPKGVLVDHKDGNGLHNWTDNFRFTDPGGNAQNAGIRRDNTSGYKGVSFYKKIGQWIASIQHEGKKYHLGYFDTPESASEAYKKAALEFHKEFACTDRRANDNHRRAQVEAELYEFRHGSLQREVQAGCS